MANRIQIRRGSGTPTSNNLLQYELGWDTTNLALYINNSGTIKKVGGEGLFLPKTGGSLSGLLTTQGNQFTDSYSGAINMNNSNIFGLNAIYTADASENASEGIHFYRDTTHVDTLWMNGGDLLFVPNRALGTGTTKANSYIVLHSNNYTTYTVTKTGTGASGTWGISVSGNAATATQVKVTSTSSPSSGSSIYYLTYTSSNTTANQDLKQSARSYIWENASSTYFCVGTQGKLGGISLYSTTDAASRYGNLQPTALTGTRTWTLPDATGTVALTSNLSSYVLKAGDTMTGALKLSSSSGVYNEGNSMFYWLSGSTSSYQKQAAIFTGTSTVNSKRVCERFYFREYSYNSSTGAAIEKWDQYRLPIVTPDITGDPNTYEILTSKSAVTIAQGGTGATTAANAIKALLNGVATSIGAVITNDTYFIRQKDDNYSYVSAQDIATYMINQVNIQDNVLNKTANYTLTAADSGKFIVVNSSSDLTITIPTNASSSIPRGAEYTIMRQGSGKVTINSSSITAVCSTTSRNLGTKRTTLLKKIATDTWYIDGEHLSS